MSQNSVSFANTSENPQFPGVQDVDPQELQKNLSKVKLIDVRQPDEFTGELGHIQNAELVVLNTLPSQINNIPRDQTVVFVCKAGGRSAQATAFARHHGFENVYNLKGGMMLWNQLQLPTTK